MKNEILRQLVHLSGVASVIFAQFAGKTLAATVFILVSLFFFLYSQYITTCEKSRKNLLQRMECRLREFALFFERKNVKPFLGPFWFYMGLGLAFLIFPLNAASAAGAVLAVSDSVSTIIGIRFGRRRIAGRKTWEGTLAFFTSAFLVCLLWFSSTVSLIAALAAAFAEILPSLFPGSGLKRLLDDNLLIPIITGFVLTTLAVVL